MIIINDPGYMRAGDIVGKRMSRHQADGLFISNFGKRKKDQKDHKKTTI